MLSSDLVKSICSIFLHDGQSVTPDHAAELLGWSLDEMDQAIKWAISSSIRQRRTRESRALN
jgi:hypothetical protein